MQNRDVHHSSSAKVNPAGKCFILLQPIVIKHFKIKWLSLTNLPLFTWLSQVAGGTQGIPPSIEITTQFLEKKRNQGYRNGILVIMIYPLYPCINISVVWHIFRHLKYTMYRLQWHSSTQVARKQTGSESVKKKQQQQNSDFSTFSSLAARYCWPSKPQKNFRGPGHWRK